MLTTICVLGLDTLSVKLVPLNNKYLKFIYVKILLFIAPLVLLSSIIIYFSSEYIAILFNETSLSNPIKVLSFSLFPLSLISINSEFFRGMKNIFYYSLYNKGSILLFLIMLLLIFNSSFFRDSQIEISNSKLLIYYYYLYSIILLSFVSTMHLFLRYLMQTQLFIPENHMLAKKNLFILSKNMLLINIVFILFQFIDTILLGLLSTSRDVGIYTIVLKISSITSIILLGVNSIIGPIISQLFSSNKLDELNMYVKASVRISSLLSIPIILLIIYNSNNFLSFFGSNLLIYKKALYIMCFAQFINVISGSVGLIMQMTGNEQIFRNIIIFSIIINIVLSLILIPKYQVWGSVYSSAFSLILWNILSIIFIKKKINIYSFIR
tara:strand:- start:294 stop:1436 length:1143 start_codon:yes stop_codon:yes gene_type:complete